MVWRRSISIVTVTILSHFLQGRAVPGAMGKNLREKAKWLLWTRSEIWDQSQKWVHVKAAGLTDREHGRKILGFFSKTAVMLGAHLHLHKL